MITVEELKLLLSDHESDRVERTESTNNTDKFSEAVCAFANDLPGHGQPGYLIIGARNDGSLAGINITDQLLTKLGGLRSDGNILPPPKIHPYKIEIEGKELAIVEVHPADLPPVRYKGRAWIRIGPRKGVASEQEERALTEKRISNARSFDALPESAATLDELSLALFATYRQEAISSDVIEANHRSIEDQLASLRFYDTKHHCATNAGLLLFGKNPRFFIPGAYIQYLKIAGAQLSDDIEDQAEISGDLLSVLRELDIRIKTLLHTTLMSKSVESILKEKTLYDYPERAIRELVMNAIMHRDYQSNAPIKLYWFSDRIEIHSPGGLYGVATMRPSMNATDYENPINNSDYRNPVIAEAMKTLEYVNRYGYGIIRAQASLRENGNPPAELSCNDKAFLAIIRKRSE